MRIIKDLPPAFPDNTYVAIDTEWFGMNKYQLHRPTSGNFGCLTICADPDVVYFVDDGNNVPEALSSIDNCIWIMQEAKFDIAQLRRWAYILPRKKLWDTLLIERILYGGYYDLFGLKHLVRRHLGIKLDKTLRDLFETATAWTDELIEYACRDASLTLQVCQAQRKVFTNEDMKIWAIDRSALWAVLDFQGIRLDVDKWKELAEYNRQQQTEIDKHLPINPRSPKQVKEYLQQHGFKNLKSSDEETLLQAIRKYPNTDARMVAEEVLQSRGFGRLASTYGLNFIEKFLEDDNGISVIHADYHIIGAETGRTSCSDPNMQNIPARDTKAYRECFLARPGNKLLIADYSAQEPAIMAYLSQDKKLIEIFASGKDVYIEVAKEVFGKNVTKKDPLRQQIKSLFLGLDYGMSPRGLALRENISVDEAETLVNSFFRLFPSVANWTAKQKKNKKYVQTVAGRKIWLNPYNDQCENNTLNAPIQGTAADMMKKALGRMHTNWQFDYPFACVGYIHDEVIFDMPEKLVDEAKTFIQNMMVQTANEMCPGIGFKADVSVGNNWSEKS